MKILNRFPRLRNLLSYLHSTLQGLPPVTHAQITKDLIRECVGKQKPTILEIGCNDGTDTLGLLDVFDNPTIYCFEPDPRAIARFKEKVDQCSNVHLFEIAISDRNGETTFYQSSGQPPDEWAKTMPEGWDQSGSIKEPKDHLIVYPWVTFDKSITVKTARLDTWCNAHGLDLIDFIWMDVQGAEMDVLRGGVDTFNKTRFLYTEYDTKELYKGQYNLKQLLKYLDDFEVIVRYPTDVLLMNKLLVTTSGKTLRRKFSKSHHKA